MEHGLVKKLPDMIRPGAKIRVQGPVTVRRGMILLQDHNVQWLGGEVDDLQEQFSLKTILQQKIGKEDVGQKGNMFADTNAPPPVHIPPQPARDRQNRPAPAPARAPVQPQPPVPQVGQGQVASLDDMMDDDDDALLLAASQIEETDSQPPPGPAASVNSSWSRPRAANPGPPVGVVQPLRTIEPSNKRQERDNSSMTKMKSQASITSFIKPKDAAVQKQGPVKTSSGAPSFSLMDSDEEEIMANMPPAPQVKSRKSGF